MLTTAPRRNKYLPDALRAYKSQTYPHRELVVVNDGSPLVAQTSDVIVVNLPSICRPWTIGEKRNIGVRVARGDYLATWDDDDISLPLRLEKQVEYATRCDASVVLLDRMVVADEDMNLVGTCARGNHRPVQASALLLREAVVRAGGYPAVSYLEDAAMHERIRYYCRGRVVVLPGHDLYVMRRHASNVTLGSGESNDDYFACGINDPRGRLLGPLVDGVRGIDASGYLEGIR
jgi:glycosyltransferase involved in cell wall biosynthesis